MIRNLVVACAVVAGWCVAPLAWSQTWPDRPIKMLVGFPPGGSTDLAARIVANKLSQALGQTVIVENRAGASGNIAADAVAQAAPDGYTLMMAATSFAAAPAFFDKLPWDPTRNFTPIAQVATVPILAVATPGVGIKSAAELVSYAKANPGKLEFASSGSGASVHLSGELFKQLTGIYMVHIPYRGTGSLIPDLISGNVAMAFPNLPSAWPLVQSGKLKALGVTTAKRSAAAPNVPSLSEAGVAGYDMSTWYGLIGPAGMPADIVQRLNKELNAVLQDPQVRSKLIAQGVDPVGGTPDEFGKFIQKETKAWAALLKTIKIDGN